MPVGDGCADWAAEALDEGRREVGSCLWGMCWEYVQKEGVRYYQVELTTVSHFEPGWALEIDGDADNLERTGSGKPSSRHCCLLKRRHPASSPWHGAPFGFCFTICWLGVA